MEERKPDEAGRPAEETGRAGVDGQSPADSATVAVDEVGRPPEGAEAAGPVGDRWAAGAADVWPPAENAYGIDWYGMAGVDGVRRLGNPDAEAETSYELSPNVPEADDAGGTRAQEDRPEDRDAEPAEGGRGIGIAALVVAILSLLFAPFLMGLVAIGLGYWAYAQGSRALGLWSMGIGALAVVIALFARFVFPPVV
ncbi:MAG: tetraspanin family protein [Hydrogenibacillus schlegelii]|uniref:Tetraspanin family protein n=1 Tax=Hydrogenibacillus schlegelii TaxID=1484 RepID=A0A947D362_HYDSH|nr:tetraspanin family protein [Hydrogenibacillus schlegelii]